MQRRHFLAGAAAAGLAAACKPSASDIQHISGDFTGNLMARGHQLRDTKAWPAPSVQRSTRVLIAGGGVAGLAAARALRLRGMDDFALLELEDSAGGNARGGHINGIACPQGAHYLPTPGDDAPELQDLLEELGLRQRVAGRWQYDERHLCHSPQERLYFKGAWQDGLLPMQGVGADTLVQYQSFAALVASARRAAPWPMPSANRPLAPMQIALAATTFEAYLSSNGLTDPHLRWYLNYCCLDDFGAGISTVSAWAGLHYFASRHGFHAPGTEGEREGVLTWPEGNAWLTQRLAAPLLERLHTGCIVLRVEPGKHGVTVDAFNTHTQAVERWQAEQVIMALPVFVAARVLAQPPGFLQQAAQNATYAPWLVANIHITQPLVDRPGAAPSWDNVVYGAPGLGYVDAMHQSLLPVPGATVLTYYRALGDASWQGKTGPSAGRQQLQNSPWSAWRDTVVAELSTAHPDLARKTDRIDITRYGHAMAIPTPSAMAYLHQFRSQNMPQRPSIKRKQLSKTLQAQAMWTPQSGRISFAHSDWAGYSVFEEAFSLGHAAGMQV